MERSVSTLVFHAFLFIEDWIGPVQSERKKGAEQMAEIERETLRQKSLFEAEGRVKVRRTLWGARGNRTADLGRPSRDEA